jgi:hypothetical protein
MNKIYISGYYTNNTPFNYEIKPSQIQTTTNTIGEEERAVDGTLNRFHVAYKKSWKLTFTNVSSGIANNLEIIFTTPSQFNFIDERNDQYTVYCEKDSFSRGLTSTNVSLRGIPVYTVDFGLTEI